MGYDPEKHHRRSIRLPGYDYARAGAYFVTICTYQRECLFGEIAGGDMRLNPLGQIVQEEWLKTAVLRPRVRLDTFVVMPNHVHGIIILNDDRGGTDDRRGTLQRAPTIELRTHHPLQRAPTRERFGQPTSDSIPTIVRLFKSATTKRINEMRKTPGVPVWQRNYYEHIIRTADELYRIQEYIAANHLRWHLDRENPHRTGEDEWEIFG